MSNKLILSLLFLAFCHITEGQKQDYVWLFGHNSKDTEGLESFRFDFNKGSSPDSIRGLLPMEFSQFNTSISDKYGNLLYYTNGCHIAGSNNEILLNGSGINEGDWVNMIPDTCDRYPGFQDGLFLESPSNSSTFYLIHKKIILKDSFYWVLNYSRINNEFGAVSLKNQPLIDSTQYMSSYLTAIHHTNRNDWWVIQPQMYTPKIYVITLDSSGFDHSYQFELPFDFSRRSAAAGTAKFSPDGNNYALYNAHDGLVLLDFDRSTGELSNLRQLKLYDPPPERQRFGSVEWSPNSRFLYLCDMDKLWQVDTWADNLDDGLVLIDEWNGVSDPFQNLFFLSNLAPDCKIYICSNSGAYSYHVINDPNQQGIDCDFVQNGVKLPFPSSIATMPNFPRFRVDEEDKCDPTITTVFGDDIYWRRDLLLYPNPVHDQLTVKLPEGEQGKIYIFDMTGQLMWNSPEQYSDQQIIIDMSGYQSGTYSIEFIPGKNDKRRIWTNKVIKVD